MLIGEPAPGGSRLQRLPPESYAIVRPVFRGLRHVLAIGSIIEGHTPACVAVDDLGNPRTAWMWDLQGEMLIGGDPTCAATNRAIARLIANDVVPDARSRGIPELGLFYDAPEWEAQLGALLPGLKHELLLRRYYAFADPRPEWRSWLSGAGAVHRLDESWLSRQDMPNAREMAGWVDSFWHSHADFVRASVGSCLVDEGAIASWCLGVFVSGQEVELAVATVPEYRGRVAAPAVAAHCVALCAERGLAPHWHCWETNIPSRRVAERVGFVNPTRYTVVYIDLRL